MNHVFTITKNEDFWLPRWLKHYLSQGFRPEEITVLNNGRPIVVPDGVTVIDVVNRVGFDHRWLRNTVMSHQVRLLCSNPTVLFAEVDEFVFWRKGRVYDLCTQLPSGESIRCTGYSPLGLEPAYDGTTSLLAHRQRMFRTAGYDKVLVSTIPITWGLGFHTAQENQGPPDPDVLLIHMWLFDFELAWRRIEERKATGARGFFGSYLTKDRMRQHFQEEFQKWSVQKLIGFQEDSPCLLYAPEPIPDFIRTL